MHRPDETYESRRALVWLYSWGTEAQPHYTITLVEKLPSGHMTSGQTWTADSFPELRQKAREVVTADLAGEVDAALWKATKQLALPLDLPEPSPLPEPSRTGRKQA